MLSSVRWCVYLMGAQVLPLALILVPVTALAQATYHFDLPSQSLSDTLRAIGSQAGFNVVFDPATVRAKTAPPISGSFTARDAIKRALEGTGLSMREVKEGSVLIVDPTLSGATNLEKPTVQDVILTPQKKERLTEDVAIALTSIKAQSLISHGDVSLDGHYMSLLGCS
jgi:hypothetical protein